MNKTQIKKRNIFIISVIVQVFFFLYAVFFKQKFILDTIFCLMAIGIFYFIENKNPLNPLIVFIGFLPFYFHNIGVLFGFFSVKVFGIGYDKWSHLINSLIATIVIFYILIANSKEKIIKNRLKNVIIAILVMLGFSLIHEVNEFIGTRYLGIYSESLFSVGDGLKPSNSDLQVYDAWWDMIFNIIGGVIAGIILLIITSFKKNYKRKKL